jgi:hypothetical protein
MLLGMTPASLLPHAASVCICWQVLKAAGSCAPLVVAGDVGLNTLRVAATVHALGLQDQVGFLAPRQTYVLIGSRKDLWDCAAAKWIESVCLATKKQAGLNM